MILDNIEKFKPLVGKNIYAKPTGNNARRGSVGRIDEFTVESVARKYVKLSCGYFSENYCPKTGATQKAINSDYVGNAGYIFFDSKESIDYYNRIEELRSKVEVAARRFSYVKLSESELNDMAKILGVENE